MSHKGTKWDAVVVGGGPNGLTAAIVLAQAGLSVLLLEAKATIGGGCRTEALTLPGFRHDVCAAIHPMGVVSPVFRSLALDRFGLEWVRTTIPLAHPLPDGNVALLRHSVDDTADGLGADGAAWRHLMHPFTRHHSEFFHEILRPVRLPRHPILMARFGLAGLQSCERLVRMHFSGPARALFTGCAAHSCVPLDRAGTAAFGLVLALAAHAVDWPCARGGSQSIVDALAHCLEKAGGRIETNRPVRTVNDLPPSHVVLFDLTPRQVAEIAADELPASFLRKLQRFRYGPGVFKIDWALSGPIPWRNAECHQAATVHVGGSSDDMMRSEWEATRGIISEQPFVLVAQQSLFDPTRAGPGQHTGWAYCHVPHGSTVDMTARIEAHLERYAPGFRDRILARHVMNTAAIMQHNANMIGGDIAGGANDLSQFLFRPFPRWNPYSTPNPRFFLCSSSTPPGGGVHGMCGYWAARSALRREFGVRESPM